jgi:hypothetical protein
MSDPGLGGMDSGYLEWHLTMEELTRIFIVTERRK